MHIVWIILMCLLVVKHKCEVASSEVAREIKNGVLVTESNDKLRIIKHVWRVFITVHEPREPRGIKGYISQIQQQVWKAYHLGYIHKNEATYRNNRVKKAQWELYQIKTRNLVQTSDVKIRMADNPEISGPTRLPPTRTKRGLFDFFGGALHHVFGLATDSDINSVKNMIRNQAKEGNRVTHSVNQLTTIINKMQKQVSVMTGTINNNIRNIKSLFQFAREANSTMWELAYNVRRSKCLYFLDSMLQQLSHVSHLYEHQILKYTRQRNSLEGHHLSHELLPPTYLQFISKNLNKSSSLVQDLSWYYKHAPVTAIRSDDFLVFKVDIHIVDLLDYLEYAISSFPAPVAHNFTLQMRLEAKHIGLNTLSGRMLQPKRCFGRSPRVCDGAIQFNSKMIPCVASIVLQKVHKMCAIEVTKTNHTETLVIENTVNSFIICTFGENIRFLCEKQPPTFQVLSTACHVLFPGGCVIESEKGWRISPAGITEQKLTLQSPQLVLDKISVINVLNMSRLRSMKVFQIQNSELEVKKIVHLEQIPEQNLDNFEFWLFQDSDFNIADVINQLCNLIVLLYVIYGIIMNRQKIRDYMIYICGKCCSIMCKKWQDKQKNEFREPYNKKAASNEHVDPSISKTIPQNAESFEMITRDCIEWNKANSGVKFVKRNSQTGVNDIGKLSFNVKKAKQKDISVDVHMDRETQVP